MPRSMGRSCSGDGDRWVGLSVGWLEAAASDSMTSSASMTSTHAQARDSVDT